MCLEGICPEGFFWRAIVKEHLAEGFCLGEQVEPNHFWPIVHWQAVDQGGDLICPNLGKSP